MPRPGQTEAASSMAASMQPFVEASVEPSVEPPAQPPAQPHLAGAPCLEQAEAVKAAESPGPARCGTPTGIRTDTRGDVCGDVRGIAPAIARVSEQEEVEEAEDAEEGKRMQRVQARQTPAHAEARVEPRAAGEEAEEGEQEEDEASRHARAEEGSNHTQADACGMRGRMALLGGTFCNRQYANVMAYPRCSAECVWLLLLAASSLLPTVSASVMPANRSSATTVAYQPPDAVRGPSYPTMQTQTQLVKAESGDLVPSEGATRAGHRQLMHGTNFASQVSHNTQLYLVRVALGLHQLS